ncbi:hypothetical protein BYT27DRAFT_7255618 [Phlegmacium glaucopus]|nr:hypothetical protein BYT27DRAFT_7255618 [Phlegmacium glaucopus]
MGHSLGEIAAAGMFRLSCCMIVAYDCSRAFSFEANLLRTNRAHPGGMAAVAAAISPSFDRIAKRDASNSEQAGGYDSPVRLTVNGDDKDEEHEPVAAVESASIPELASGPQSRTPWHAASVTVAGAR